jgi:hypothetical protein
MKKIYLFAAIIFASTSYGQIINPVSATTTFTPDFGTLLSTTYDGTGLLSFPSLSANHEETIPTNSFVAVESTGTIDFDLGGTVVIEGLSFWNQNAGGPSTDVGLNTVNFYASLDGSNFTLIPGAPTAFAEVLTLESPPEVFTFPAIEVAFIRLEVLSNHGAAQSGFAEIAFAEGTLSVTDFELNSGFKIYPNPAKDTINIKGLSEATNYIIYNVLGVTVKSGIIYNNKSIVINELSEGLYYLRLDSGNTKKFIKK